jgi:UDP-GlcNAc:undecaprenyl-phosphate GlcNAc-1-phosphate transferase
MNAVNFLDNMNGMVGGITAIAMAAFAWDSAHRGEPALAAGQLAVCGACVGFLRYNFPRGRVFLGDAGSLFLGYSLAASGLLAFHGGAGGWAKPGPIIMLGYPVFDMVFVVVNRSREGRHVYEGGKDHTNHRLASVLGCQKRTVKLIWLVGAALSVSGLVVLNLNRPLPTLLLLGLWITTFLVAGVKLSSVPVSRAEPSNHGLPAAASPPTRT